MVDCLQRGWFCVLTPTGTDSIAFILVNPLSKQFGLLKCLRNPTEKWAVRAFTGSLDVPGEIWYSDVCQQEVKEEAGLEVEFYNIHRVGTFEVSHQTDENVYLYVVDVTDAKECDKEPDGPWEGMFSVEWNTPTNDWKAIIAMNWWCQKNNWPLDTWSRSINGGLYEVDRLARRTPNGELRCTRVV